MAVAESSSSNSTKRQLLSLLDDIELIAKELIQYVAMPQDKQPDDIDAGQLMELLLQKDKELKDTWKVAEEQLELQEKYDALKELVDQRDAEIQQLQKGLKEAENILSTAIYQAEQKLKNISQASEKRISSEDLIRYAHKLSASNVVAAPSTWVQGDPRRPYPTDHQMRMGALAKFNEIMDKHSYGQGVPMLSELLGHTRPSPPQSMDQSILGTPSAGTASMYNWQSSLGAGDGQQTGSPSRVGALGAASLGMGASMTTPLSVETRFHITDDVTLMSSDSSSSSSSDE